MYDDIIEAETQAVSPNIVEALSALLDQKIAAALHSKEKPVDEHKAKTLQALQELIRKVQTDEVTGLAVVTVGPAPQPSHAYSNGSSGFGPLLGELELIKGRIVSALLAPQQQQPA